MVLNSAVTPEGGEIARAQVVQAEAAGIQPTVYMNPILIKPKQDMQAQVITMGVSLGDMSANEYRSDYLAKAESMVINCIQRLKEEYQILVIEGAGSPAEVNLKDRDIVNMKTAELAGAPVLLVADIDRGGVFASLIGTLELLEPHERNRVKGFIINKFRGDLNLLKPGLEFLEERTKIPVLGVIPYLYEHGIEEEDAVFMSEMTPSSDTDVQHSYDNLARMVRKSLAMEKLYQIMDLA
jgi:adenosylcobyric acid synthase